MEMPHILEYMVREYQKRGREISSDTGNVGPCKLAVAHSTRSNAQEWHAT